MNRKMSRRQRDIKSKLMAAISMLLVSSIMMVSSTYAWFTLSTAPELKGITTAVGANGNLEMALLPLDATTTTEADYGITTGTTDSMAVQDANLANVTWGNLVDLSQYYGLENIVLKPTALNRVLDGSGQPTEVLSPGVTNAFLSFPKYGADGRIAELSNGTVTGVYDTVTSTVYQKGRVPAEADPGYTEVADPSGVRIIGAISGMSERQLAHRNAVNEVTNKMSSAVATARTVLSSKGNTLAAIAVKYAADKGATYTQDEIAVLGDIVEALEGSLSSIEAAYRYAIYAYVIATQDGYASQQDAILNTTPLAELATNYPAVATGINALITSQGKVTSATTGMSELTGDSITFTTLNDKVLKYLANKDFMSVNGEDVDNVTPGFILSTYNQGINLLLKSGSGIFADIADHCDNYGEGIQIPGSAVSGLVQGIPADFSIEANMSTQSSVVPNYLNAAKSFASSVDVPGESDAETSAKPISDYYGYIIDLAFRTNAPDSTLRLQTSAVDRIYTDGTPNANTMGGGSTMKFTKVDPSFSDTQMENLMKHVRVVFFNPETNAILAYAVPQVTERGSTMVAELLLATSPIPDTNGGYHLIQGNDLMPLVQNQAHRLSVLVYLDGTTITNADVAIGAGQSMIGSLNLQFSSNATLVPMEYSDLMDNEDGMTDVTEEATASTGYEVSNVMHHPSGLLGGVLTQNGAAVTDANATVEITAKVNGTDVTKPATYQTVGVVKAWGASGFGDDPDNITDITFTVTPRAGVALTNITYEGGVTGSGRFNGNAVTIDLTPPAGKTIATATATVTNKTISEGSMAYSNNKLTFNCDGIKNNDAIKVTVTFEEETAATYTVTMDEGVTGAATATAGVDYPFTVDTATHTLGTVTVGGTTVTPNGGTDGNYTIPGASVNGNIEITATANPTP